MNQAQNQKNKEVIWEYWQKMNHVEAGQLAGVVRAAVHDNVNWNGPHPINHLDGAEALLTDFWQPLLKSFLDLKRQPYIFMGGASGGEEWVSGIGYFTGTFVHDWLDIPATGRKADIPFGQFYLMREGKIAESYMVMDLLAVMRQAGFQVLPPARGGEGGKIPGPFTQDGLLFTEQDKLETQQTKYLVQAMLTGMHRYVRSRDGGDLRSMEQEHYWVPGMHWYGPTSIGACLSLEEFQDFHQRPWLHGFGDRGVHADATHGRAIGMGRNDYLAEGRYASLGIWDRAFSVHHGEYQGVPAKDKKMTIRDFDWYRRDGDRLAQNWCPIDMIDLFRQMGVDLFDRMRRQVEQRRRGLPWYTSAA